MREQIIFRLVSADFLGLISHGPSLGYGVASVTKQGNTKSVAKVTNHEPIRLAVRKHISKQVSNRDKITLLSNVVSLTILQIANYLLPLVTIPYLVRILGADYFGLLAFAMAFITYFMVFVDYGFNLTATKSLSIHRMDIQKVEEIFSAVMTIKALLVTVGLFIMSIIIFSYDRLYENQEVYFFTYGMVIGQAMFPVWLFQGLEKMQYIAYLNVLAKGIFTIAIFLLVDNQADYYLVPILNSLGFVVAGILSLYIVRTCLGIRFRRQGIATIRKYLIDGWNVFISNLAISIYTTSVPFILGLTASNAVVGYFSAADKIMQAFKNMLAPVMQAFYPFVSKRVAISKEEGMKVIRSVAGYVAVFTAIAGLFVFFSAEWLVGLLLGEGFERSATLLRIMSLLPFFVGMSNVFGILTMLPFNHTVSFSRILMVGSAISIFLSLFLVPLYEDSGAAVVMIITEGAIALAMAIYLQTNNLKLIGKP